MSGKPAGAETAADSNSEGDRFDLLFHGEVLSGHRREQTIAAFARLFAIDDTDRARRFFRGDEVTLRRHLSREEAAHWYVRLRRIGMVVALRASDRGEHGTEPAAPEPKAATSGTAAPNLYALVPWSSDPQRPIRAAQLARGLWGLSAVAALLALLLTALHTLLWSQPELPRLRAATSTANGELWLATDEALLSHDRSGRALQALSLEALAVDSPVVALTGGREGQLWMLSEAGDGTRLLQHCVLEDGSCRALLSGTLLTLHWLPRQAQLILAHSGGLQLLDEGGQLLASSPYSPARNPGLLAVEGLLFTNAPEGPALNVLRPERAHFGEQLDQLLVLPHDGLRAELASTGPFARVADGWWVTLSQSDGSAQELHRFDSQWRGLGAVTLPAATRVDAVLAWGDRVLVADFRRDHLLRYSANGEPLAPLAVSALQARRDDLEQRASQIEGWWQWSRALLLAVALLAAGLGLWQHLRARVLAQTQLTQATAPLRAPDSMLWLPVDPRRLRRLLQFTLLLAGLALTGSTLLAGASVSTLALGSLLLVLGCTALGLWWLARAPLDMLGLRGSQLVLVDHRGRYRSGPAREARWNRGCIALGDLVVFTGNRWLPALDTTQHARELGLLLNHSARLPLLHSLVLLVASRHPLGIAGLLLAAGLVVSLLLLCL
ncbi:hypothetical protein [Haliea atlantica]